MKKILKIMFGIIIIILIGLETINYFEYKNAKNNWKLNTIHSRYYGAPPGPYEPTLITTYEPRPIYRLVVVQCFYKVFPFLNKTRYDNVVPMKPVIYLYPTKTEKVKVQLDYKGTLMADYPAYDYSKKGWEVTAYPDGKIVNSDGKEYSYLFWEGKNSDSVNYNLSTGFVVKGEDTVEFLQNTLSKMGLTPKEYNEFIVYWYPKMKDSKYNLIHFADKQYTDTAPLTITPTPDSILRVFMVYKSLDNIIDINPQEIKSFNRQGFSVVEWGGAEIK